LAIAHRILCVKRGGRAEPKDYRSIERLILPLARDGERVDMLLAVSIYLRAGRG
jgi:hypothetical protein